MFFLILAILALIVSSLLRSRKAARLNQVIVAVFYVALIAWILSAGGMRVFAGGEAGLLGWFVGGLVFSLLGYLLPNKPAIAILVAALCYAMGFDVLQPDAYSYVPAAILAALILVVAVSAFLRLASASKKVKPTRVSNPKSQFEIRNSKILFSAYNLRLGVCVFAIAILVYSATFKVIDRGWLLPWSYMAAAGGILFAVSQLWQGLRTKDVPLWAQVTVGRLGELLMVVSAFFVYREFL